LEIEARRMETWMDNAKRKAIYAGSFDPVTNGHLYLIREGARLFDELVVAVGTNPGKRYTFSPAERLDMLARSAKDIDNVEIVEMSKVYLVDFAQSVGASYILRGVRNESDYLNERTMRNVNADMAPEITTVFLMPPRGIAEVSSSFVKGLAGPEGWERLVESYLPPEVLDTFRSRFGKEG